jgi:hypothetical protein
MAKAEIEVHFTHPDSPRTLTALVSLQCTGQKALEGLLTGDDQEPFLEQLPSDQLYELIIQRSVQPIKPNMTFEQANVLNGDVIQVQRSRKIKLLTKQELHDRLRLDYEIVMNMRSPVMNVTAYRNANDLEVQRNPILSQEEGHLATHYLVDYYIKTLIGPDQYSDKTSVNFDLLANGNYPYTLPSCFVISSPMPWTPHFKEGCPVHTDYDLWEEAEGRMLLGHWLIFVAKLLNCDEIIPRAENYGGFNPLAMHYWRTKLKRQPITPTLAYPVLPSEVSSSVRSLFDYLVGRRWKHNSQEKLKPSLHVFLCHAHGDKQAVRNLYNQLCNSGVDAWLDEEKLLPGQKWEREIPKAVKNSDVVIVCLSKAAINKSGYVQKEIKYALDIADEKPDDSIFIIPLKLEQCDIPDRLRPLHCVGLFEEHGYERLMLALKSCADKLM